MTSNIVKFIYRNKIVEINNPDPNETILNYIGSHLASSVSRITPR